MSIGRLVGNLKSGGLLQLAGFADIPPEGTIDGSSLRLGMVSAEGVFEGIDDGSVLGSID